MKNTSNRAKRLKTVFTNSQLAHVWASQTQREGRNSSRSMFFIDDEIYSYGYHYLIAKFHGDTVLISNKGYSTTTGQHTNDVIRAVQHLKTYHVSNPNDVKQSAVDMANSIVDRYTSILTATNPCGYRVAYLVESVESFNRFCKDFNIKDSINLSDEFKQHLKDIVKYREARKEAIYNSPENVQKRQLQAIIDEQKRIENERQAKEALSNWLAGGSWSWSLSYLNPMRIRIRDDIVQTTGGAEVPLEHAKRLLNLVLKKQRVKGQRVGHFTVDKLDGDIIEIGCHKISIEHAKEVLGVA